jgi:hypothetical protein
MFRKPLLSRGHGMNGLEEFLASKTLVTVIS